jgi:hypothetical protein
MYVKYLNPQYYTQTLISTITTLVTNSILETVSIIRFRGPPQNAAKYDLNTNLK